jgi:hypothetical protein
VVSEVEAIAQILKLARFPTPSPLTLATLPSMSLIPSAPFTDHKRIRLQRMRSNGRAFKPGNQEKIRSRRFLTAAWIIRRSMLDVGRFLLPNITLHPFSFLIETHSLPTLVRCYPRSFTVYVAYPIRSILTSYFLIHTSLR